LLLVPIYLGFITYIIVTKLEYLFHSVEMDKKYVNMIKPEYNFLKIHIILLNSIATYFCSCLAPRLKFATKKQLLRLTYTISFL